jgi:hypothetical protein
MISPLCLLEVHRLDAMTRQQLLEAIRSRRYGLPPDLEGPLEDEPTDRLRLLLLAARLIGALRRTRSQDWGEERVHP